MKKLIVKALALVVMVFGQTAKAQEASDGVMQITLQQAVEQALQFSKTLQNSETDVKIYKEKIREARANWLPQVSGEASGTTYFGKEMNFGGMPIKMENSIVIKATASWTLAMQAIKGYQIQKIAAQLMELQNANSILDVKKNIIDTYYGILIYERNKEIIEKNLVEMSEIQRQTRNLYNAGYVEMVDTLQLAVNVLNLKNVIISMQRGIETSKRLLILQMGLPVTTKIECTDNIDAYIAESSINQMKQAVTGEGFKMEQNLDYQLLQKNITIGEETVKLQKFGWIPTLTAAYQYSNALKGGFMNFDHVGNLILSVPIFDGLSKNSKKRQAQMELEKSRTNMQLLQESLMQSDMQYRSDLRTALEAYELQKVNLEVAREVLSQNKIKYEVGKLSSLDLTTANANYLQAESSYAEACINLVNAQTQLMRLYNAL